MTALEETETTGDIEQPENKDPRRSEIFETEDVREVERAKLQAKRDEEWVSVTYETRPEFLPLNFRSFEALASAYGSAERRLAETFQNRASLRDANEALIAENADLRDELGEAVMRLGDLRRRGLA